MDELINQKSQKWPCRKEWVKSTIVLSCVLSIDCPVLLDDYKSASGLSYAWFWQLLN